MPNPLPIPKILFWEFFSGPSGRTPEPDLVMASEEQAAAYTYAGREAGVMAPVYLFHAAQICDVLRPGDLVVDLACGPATQLAMVARLNPECRFLGVDLSDEMLLRAKQYVESESIGNVEFRKADITKLDFLADRSVDAFMSTMALHHLPVERYLTEVFASISRALKPDGGLYLADFGLLKSQKTIRALADQYADIQPEIFTTDYFNSLCAAFTKATFGAAAEQLGGLAKTYATAFVPYMVAVKSAHRGQRNEAAQAALQRFFDGLPEHHKSDYRNLKRFFAIGGLHGAHCP